MEVDTTAPSPVPTECSICFESISPTTGHATLGCAHSFHLMCVVRWFQEQDGPSSCPFCRHEVGTLDNVPIYPDSDNEEEEGGDDSDDDDDSTLDGWSADDDADDDDDDTDSVGSIRRLWTRDAATGQWEGRWILHRPTVASWNPATDPADVPEELSDVATTIQRIWRGYRDRRPAAATAPPPSPATGAQPAPANTTPEAEAVLGLLKLSTPSRAWIMSRMMRVD